MTDLARSRMAKGIWIRLVLIYSKYHKALLTFWVQQRNKFFYKELRDHLESHARQSIGFLNDWFFIMDPKLHVGPINRDGTFEKRVRLHFIEWLELKHTNLWICWGTLLDTSYLPVFREGSSVYRIPGNQSSVFKTNRSFQGWNVGDDGAFKLVYCHWTAIITTSTP